jgi:hypothetical protein
VSGQGDLLDARLMLAHFTLGMHLWAEIRGQRLRAFQLEQDANGCWCAVHRERAQ